MFVSHEKAELETVLGLLFGETKEGDAGFEAVLRFEPMIVAVDCKDLDAARLLVGVAVSSGFRESGKCIFFALWGIDCPVLAQSVVTFCF